MSNWNYDNKNKCWILSEKIKKYQNPSGALVTKELFKTNSLNYYNQHYSLQNYDNVYATELNDSIQSSSNEYLSKIDKYKTAISNSGGDYMNLDKKGVFNYGKTKPYFKGFNSKIAEEIYRIGKSRNLTDAQIAVLIESAWRESSLKPSTHRKDSDGNTIAYGLWLFDGPAGTYNNYLNYLQGKRPENVSALLNFLIDNYMPTRGDFISKYWNNPNITVEELAKQFLVKVESPKNKNNVNYLNRTMRGARTLFTRKPKDLIK